jgi:glucosamine kinase
LQRILAVDAGGTHTRAVVVDLTGRCLGYGSAGGGNPVSSGVDCAVEAVTTAAGAATAAPRTRAAGTMGQTECESIVLAVAGGGSSKARYELARGLTRLGLRGEVNIEPDLLATYCSGTCDPDGYALVAGTGSVAARVLGGRLDGVADGMGWLLGDAGSGYWIGRRVVRAVVGSLDGRAPQTTLTPALLASLQISMTPERASGRPRMLSHLLDALYGLRPVELSQFAPLAFRAGDDPIAAAIVSEAANALATTLAAVSERDRRGPLVIGGGVARAMVATIPTFAGTAAAAVDAEVVLTVPDGLVGAAVLGLRRSGVEVDADMFRRVAATIDATRPEAEQMPEGPSPRRAASVNAKPGDAGCR